MGITAFWAFVWVLCRVGCENHSGELHLTTTRRAIHMLYHDFYLFFLKIWSFHILLFYFFFGSAPIICRFI